MKSRRNFVRSAVSVASLGVIGTAMGKPENTGAKEIGLTKAVEAQLKKGREEKAKRLLNKHNIKHGYGKKTVNSDKKESDKEVSIQWNYTKSGATLNCLAFQNSGDRWTIYGTVRFPSGQHNTEYSRGWPHKIADGCGIVFDHDEWSAPEPTDEGVEYPWEDRLTMEHEEYNPNYGPTAKVHHPTRAEANYDRSAGIKTTLLKKNSGNDIPVKFAYEHTYAFTELSGEVNVNIAYGALSDHYLSADGQRGMTRLVQICRVIS